jgi:8-oxo-dGTP pyrophosphatase MutT (NUDIX family)
MIMNIDSEQIKYSNLFIKWKNKFEQSGCKIERVRILSAVKRDEQKYRSIYLECDYVSPELYRQTRTILLRGPAVVVMPMCIIRSELNFVVVRQRRIFDGKYTTEFPSGGVDDEDNEIKDPFRMAALRELQEETGIRTTPERLVMLQENVIVCSSAMDESATWFAILLSLEDLNNLKRISGNQKDGEHITTCLISEAELSLEWTSHILTGLALLRVKRLKLLGYSDVSKIPNL